MHKFRIPIYLFFKLLTFPSFGLPLALTYHCSFFHLHQFCQSLSFAFFSSMASGRKASNEFILQDLKNGIAKYELVTNLTVSQESTSLRFFARIGPSLGISPAMKKLEHYSVQRVTGDGRCMFRALVKGMARNKGITVSPSEERDDADDLRMAVKEVICDSEKERARYEEALIAITVDESLKRYCQRIESSNFWGGESELLVLSKLCCQPIIVYIPEKEHARTAGNGFIPIAEYGSEFRKKSKKGKARLPVRLLYSGKNHYDLLV